MRRLWSHPAGDITVSMAVLCHRMACALYAYLSGECEVHVGDLVWVRTCVLFSSLVFVWSPHFVSSVVCDKCQQMCLPS